jgi:hypothetical protein
MEKKQMEDIRTYNDEDQQRQTASDEERAEWLAAAEDEAPFHIPRD